MSLVDRVSDLLAEVVAEEVMPRFHALAVDDIEKKPTAGDPDDIVTVADREVERRLEAALSALLPGSLVIGEEAVHTQPQLLNRLAGSEPVWLIDPIDGTRNFARGDDAFGVMIALVRAGATCAAWIALPARHQTWVAEMGAGTFLDRMRVRTPAPASDLRGTLYTRFMPEEIAAAMQRNSANKYLAHAGANAAAIEYTSLVRGEKDFVVYYRLLPWDHSPGALVLSEAGGCVEHLDGRPYAPSARNEVTILAGMSSVCATVQSWLR